MVYSLQYLMISPTSPTSSATITPASAAAVGALGIAWTLNPSLYALAHCFAVNDGKV